MRIRTHDKSPWLDRLLRAKDRLILAYKAKDAEEVKKAEEEVKDAEAAIPATALENEETGDTHVHIHHDESTVAAGNAGHDIEAVRMTDEEIKGEFTGVKDTLTKMGATLDGIAKHVGYSAEDAEVTGVIEGELEEEAPAGTGDKARKARDSVYLADSHQGAVATAEILMPGISIPAYDRAAAPRKTYDAVCKLRRNVLDLMNNTAPGRSMIESVHGKRLTLDGMSCRDVRVLFNAVGALKKQQNRDGTQGRDRMSLSDGGSNKGRVTVADIQKLNEAARAKKKAA